jgi:hypothetical protein
VLFLLLLYLCTSFTFIGCLLILLCFWFQYLLQLSQLLTGL